MSRPTFLEICEEFFEQIHPNHFKNENDDEQDINNNINNKINDFLNFYVIKFIQLFSFFDTKEESEAKHQVY